MKKYIILLLLVITSAVFGQTQKNVLFAIDPDSPANGTIIYVPNSPTTGLKKIVGRIKSDESWEFQQDSVRFTKLAGGGNRIPMFNNNGTFKALASSVFGRSFLNLADAGAARTLIGAGTGSGTVTTVSVTTANGVTGSVSNATTTPAITLSLGAITPTTIVASGNVTAPNIDATNKADIAGKQPLDSDLTAIAALTTDGFGRGLLIQTSAANVRSYIGAGTGTGDALTTSPLSQFAATTSSQLAGVLSDETGTGASVFATSPTLVTPNLGTPSAVNLTNGTSLPESGVTNLVSDLAGKEVALAFSTGLTRTTNTITNNLSTGVSGGQTINGGIGSGDGLTIEPTTNATKGVVKVSVLGSGATSGGLAVGTANPNANKISGDADHIFNIVNNGTGMQVLAISTYGAGGLAGENNIHPNRYRGTEAVPLAVLSGDTAFSVGGRMFDGTALGNSSVSFSGVATQNFAVGAHGTELRWGTTPDNSAIRNHAMSLKGSGALYLSPNVSLTPYRTTTNFVIDGATSGYTGDFRALLQSTTTNGAGIIFGNSTSKEGYIVRYGSSYSGNFSGTSLPFADAMLIQSGPTSNLPIVNNAGSIVNLIGTTSSNPATRMSTAGMRITTLANAQTDGTAKLQIDGGSATAGTAPLKINSGTVLSTTEAGAIENDGTHLYYTASNGGTRYQLDRQAIGGSVSTTGTATTVFTVTIGSTQANTTYKTAVTPTSSLAAGLFYVTNKTTTTFDVTYLSGLTGSVSFDWILTP